MAGCAETVFEIYCKSPEVPKGTFRIKAVVKISGKPGLWLVAYTKDSSLVV